jgi:cation diffusion facilitator family transporter
MPPWNRGTQGARQVRDRAEEKTRIIRAASITALAGNAILAALKIGMGLYGGSLAVVGDGIDSSVDVLIAIMSLVVSGIIARPADEGHPWGHGRAETVATAILACLLFFAGAQLILNSAMNLIKGVTLTIPAMPALIATLVSMGGKGFLAAGQYVFSKRANSAMLRANAKNMAGDIILSGGVLLGIVLARGLSLSAIDSLMAILVGLWVMRSSVGIFTEANSELMDGAAGAESYRMVFDAVRSVPEAGNPHRTRIRRIAGLWDIDIDIEVAPHLTVLEAHWIAHRVERAIKERIEGVYDIMVHVEPAGNMESEGFGLRE